MPPKKGENTLGRPALRSRKLPNVQEGKIRVSDDGMESEEGPDETVHRRQDNKTEQSRGDPSSTCVSGRKRWSPSITEGVRREPAAVPDVCQEGRRHLHKIKRKGLLTALCSGQALPLTIYRRGKYDLFTGIGEIMRGRRSYRRPPSRHPEQRRGGCSSLPDP